jgi:hypothetical protein
LVFRGELPAGSDQKASFSPWLIGWAGDDVYLEITGCPGDSGDPCYGPLRRRAQYRWSPTGGLAEAQGAPALVLTSTLNTPARYVNIGVESYGVSSSTRMGVKRDPLMRFEAVQLELVR